MMVIEWLRQIGTEWLFLGVAFLALILSFGGLVLSFVVGWQNHKHNRLSVIPNLMFNKDFQRCTLALQNRGIGPAIIKKVTVLLDGVEMKGEEVKVWDEIGQRFELDTRGRISIISEGEGISAGEDFMLLDFWHFKNESIESFVTKDQEKFRHLIESLDIIVGYQSLYKEPKEPLTESLKKGVK